MSDVSADALKDYQMGYSTGYGEQLISARTWTPAAEDLGGSDEIWILNGSYSTVFGSTTVRGRVYGQMFFLCAMTVRPAVEADIGGSAFHLRYYNDNLQQQQSDLLVPD